MDVESINPWTGRVEYRYRYQDAPTVEASLERARLAAAPWAALPLAARGDFVRRLGGELRAGREALATTMTAEK